jgi:energy-coupling factor transporter ATP-binding protein EcfA2
MAATSFRVEQDKALRLAECQTIPPLMVICGANGTGKSTLLWALKQKRGLVLDPVGTEVLYQGPHRAIRRQNVQRRWLGGPLTGYSDMLAGDSVVVPEGLSIPYPSRSPDNVDESGSAIKHALGRLENRRQSYIAARYDEAVDLGESALPVGAVPRIFAPLAELVARLLPHLTFKGIDFAQEDNIRVAFIRKDSATELELDLDDLSSGEKAVILLFLPLVESEIRENLNLASRGTPEEVIRPDRVFMLDEPELHIHPDLQRRMLAYMRERSAGGQIQFILITHSPTILDEANDDELYVLGPASSDNRNQLQHAASPSERLSALRELTGESYFLSTGRNIVCVEGEVGPVNGKLSDRSLIEIFNSRSSRYTFIPMGGRSQVMTAVRRLQESLPVEQYGVSVVGLVDADRGQPEADSVVAWPYCEIENALLISEAIKLAVMDLDDTRSLALPEIEAIIQEAASRMRDEEVRVRVAAQLGTKVFRFGGVDVATVKHSLMSAIGELQALHDSGSIEEICDRVALKVDQELADRSFVRKFRGKQLLRKVFQALSIDNVSYERFCYTLANRAKVDVATAAELNCVFDELDRVVDAQLAVVLGTGD